MDPSSNGSERLVRPSAEFIAEFTRSQRRLFLYILSLVHDPVDAEEVLQETNLVIWKKYDEFEPGTNFPAWAMQIARYQVLQARQRFAREKLRFSQEFVDAVAAHTEQSTDELDRQRRALRLCLGKLSSDDRRLIQQRYQPGTSGLDLAAALNRPVNSIYQSLGRIRRVLLDCVSRTLSAEVV